MDLVALVAGAALAVATYGLYLLVARLMRSAR